MSVDIESDDIGNMSRLVCVSDYKKMADVVLGKMEKAHLNPGADEEVTVRDNEEAFKKVRLRPRLLRGVSIAELQTTLLGHAVSMPIGVAPSGRHGVFYSEGEIATARAAEGTGCCYIMSTSATRSVEAVSEAAPEGLNWFQVYILKDRDKTAENVKRAAKAGFKVIVLTADAPKPGMRRSTLRTPLVQGPSLNMPMLPKDDSFIPGTGGFDPAVTWEDIWWLKKESELPVVVKGILTAEDTELAIQHGADAVYVSNHGGRQLDTVQATIDALPEVVAAARGRVEVYLDGGVRTGTDVLKALALGARAVFVGRPAIWGLACKGQQGLYDLLSLLQEELSLAMVLSGCRSLDDINGNLIMRKATVAKM